MNVYTMESANLFCGDEAGAQSNALILGPLKLPSMEENYADWLPGGAPVAIEIDTHLQRLEATFSLLGWQPKIMGMIRASSRLNQSFTAYGLIRDRRTGKANEAKAVMQGRLGRVNPTEFRKGTNQEHEFSIRSIVHYELTMMGEEIYYWDFFTSTFRADGTDLNQDFNQILRIPTNA